MKTFSNVFLISIFCLSYLFMNSCGGKKSKNNPEKTDTTTQKDTTPVIASWEQVYKKSNDLMGKTIILKGYLSVPSYIQLGNSTISIDLYERYNQYHGPYLSIPMPVGTGNGTMDKLRDQFLSSDIVFRDDDGNVLKEGDHVEIKLEIDQYGFRVSRVAGFKKLSNEQADYSTYTVLPFTDELSLDSAKSQDELVVLEGVLEVPYIFYQEQDILLDFKKSNLKSPVGAYIQLGEGPSRMDPLPDGYTDKDIRIRDRNGNEIKKNQRVKIYGTYSINLVHTGTEGEHAGYIHVECIEGL